MIFLYFITIFKNYIQIESFGGIIRYIWPMLFGEKIDLQKIISYLK